MQKIKSLIIALLCAVAQGAWAQSGNWTDEGNYSTDWEIEMYEEPEYGYHYLYIANEKQLAGLAYEVNHGNQFYNYVIKITADLNMSAHYWTPIGTETHKLHASFDGQGHTISGITVNRPEEDYNGLFGYVEIYFDEYASEYRRIQNLVLKNCKITGKDYTGGVSGFISSEDRLYKVYCDAEVSGADYVGGLLGYADSDEEDDAEIEKCLYLGNSVSATGSHVGAICGYYDGDAKNSGSYYTDPSITHTNSKDVRAYTVKKGNIPSSVSLSYSGGSGISYDGNYYVPKNKTVTISAHNDGADQYVSDIQVDGTSIASGGKFSFNVDGSKDEYVVTVTLSSTGIEGTGAANNPYLIKNSDQWDLFAGRVNNGQSFSGSFIKLDADITVTTMWGNGTSKCFSGTFDGNGNTLTLDYSSSSDYAAPFRYINGAAIQNLKVAGNIATSNKFAAGIAGYAKGDNTISNCYVNATINSSKSGDGTHGGLVANIQEGTTTITGCRFTGELLGSSTSDWGGFVGFTEGDNDAKVEISNSLFYPSTCEATSGSTFARYRNTSDVSISTCYYITSFGTVQGTQAYATEQAELNKKVTFCDVDLYLLASVNIDNCYGLTEDLLVVTPVVTVLGETLGTDNYTYVIKDSGDNNVTAGITAKGKYTITVTGVNAKSCYGETTTSFTVTIGDGTEASPYQIASADDWISIDADISNGNTFSGKYFKMMADFTLTSSMWGTSDNKFEGVFDGDDHTLTLDYSSSSDYAAPFRYINGATIKNLKVAGNIATSNKFAAGIAGQAKGNNTISNCYVDATINSSKSGDGTHGGLVANISDGTTTIDGCRFKGRLKGSSTTNWGGFVGWIEGNNGAKAEISNSLFYPSTCEATSGATFARYRSSENVNITNSYYVRSFGTVQGTQAYTEEPTALNKILTFCGVPDLYFLATMNGISDNYTLTPGEPIVVRPSSVTAAGVTLDEGDYTVNIIDTQSSTDVTSGISTYGRYKITITGVNDKECYGSTSQEFDVSVGAGTAENPYLIADVNTWRFFGEKISNGEYTDSYFKMSADVTARTMWGTSDHPFTGTFDGNGHTLTFKYNASADYCAPFRYISGATLKDLHVTGNINGSDYTVLAGLVANIAGGSTNTITNCLVDVDITSSATGDATIGGLVASIAANTTTAITGCAFTGSIDALDAYGTGGLVGWRQQDTGNETNLTLTDCLFKPASVNVSDNENNQPLVRSTDKSTSKLTVTNSYITETIHAGNVQGKVARSITAVENATVENAGTATAYTVSGITSYGTGVKFNDVLYAGNEDVVSLNITVNSNGYKPAVSAGKLTGTASPYTLTMPDEDVTVTLTAAEWDGDGSENTPYLIYNSGQWDLLADNVNAGTDYNGMYFQLESDISVTTMVGQGTNRFRGTFDGNGHTITVNYNATEDYCAPFRHISGATIKNVKTAGTIETSARYAAGIVAYSRYYSKIENCRSSVTIKSSYAEDARHGGILGLKAWVTLSKPTIEGCVFDGKILTTGETATTGCGGIVGFTNGQTLTIKNCLYKPAALEDGETAVACSTIYDNSESKPSTVTCTNCYYTEALGTAQGTPTTVYDDAPANLGELVKDYGMLTAYANGILFNSKYYVGVAEDIIFTDNADNDVASRNGCLANVTINGRTLYKDGYWNTICLPFDMTADQVTTQLAPSALMELDVTGKYDEGKQTGFDDGTLYLYFKNATEGIEAGKPYIIKWADGNDIENPEFTGVTISNADTDAKKIVSDDGKVSFIGNFNPVSISGNSYLYLGANNKLYWPSADKPINSFRGYFHVDLGTTSGVRAFVLNFGEDETTGIVGIEQGTWNLEHSAGTGWYDLSGRKLAKKPTSKGIYIYNGKKRIIK